MAAKAPVGEKKGQATARSPKKSVRKTGGETKSKAARKKTVAGASAIPKTASRRSTARKGGKSAEQGKTRIPSRVAAKKPSLTAKGSMSPKREKKTALETSRKSSGISPEEQRMLALRKSLIRRREEIIKEVKNEISKYIKGENRQLVDTALDDGDWSVVDLSEDISFKHMSTHRENLLKIDEALRKLSEGTYGICEDCGEKIGERRLTILPFAIYCTDCQEHREQLEEMEKREGLIGS